MDKTLLKLSSYKYPIYIADDYADEEEILANYIMHKCVLSENQKIVFTTGDCIFISVKSILNKLQKICIDENISFGKRGNTVDRIKLQINTNEVIGIPIGDGSKIRGLRPNILICDRFDKFNDDKLKIFEEQICAGFATVSQDNKKTQIIISNVKDYREDGNIDRYISTYNKIINCCDNVDYFADYNREDYIIIG